MLALELSQGINKSHKDLDTLSNHLITLPGAYTVTYFETGIFKNMLNTFYIPKAHEHSILLRGEL